VWFLGLFAIGIAGAAVAPNVWIGVVAMIVSGVGNGGAVVANIVLVQRGAPDHLRGRAFTLIMSANYSVFGVALVLAGPITNAVDARWAYAGSAVTILIAAVVAWRFLRGAEQDVHAVAQAV
jgi:MFS family permease